MTEQINFPGHVSYPIQGKNHTLLTTARHDCKNWHAEVCKANSTPNTNIFVILKEFGQHERDCIVPVCECACHWRGLNPDMFTAASDTTPPKKPRKKRNGKG